MATREAKGKKTAAKNPGAKKSGARKSGAKKSPRKGAGGGATKRAAPFPKSFFWIFGFGGESLQLARGQETSGPPIKIQLGSGKAPDLRALAEIKMKDRDARRLVLITSPTFTSRKAAEEWAESGTGAPLWKNCENCVLYAAGPG